MGVYGHSVILTPVPLPQKIHLRTLLLHHSIHHYLQPLLLVKLFVFKEALLILMSELGLNDYGEHSHRRLQKKK